MLEIGCGWSKGSGERLQGHHGPLVSLYMNPASIISILISAKLNPVSHSFMYLISGYYGASGYRCSYWGHI